MTKTKIRAVDRAATMAYRTMAYEMNLVRFVNIYKSIEAAETALFIAKKDLILFGGAIGLCLKPKKVKK